MSKEKKDKGGEGEGSWWCYMMLGPLLLWMVPQQHLHLTHSSLIFASYIQHLPSVCPDGWPLFVQPFIVTSGTPLREDTFVHLHHSVSGETRLSHVFQKEKNNGSTIQALHCFASFWPPKTWCFPFCERCCSCHSSCSVAKMCLTLQPHALQQARLLCPPLSPRICPNLCPLSRWCYLIISSFAAPFSFSLQSFLYKDFFPMSQLFESGGRSIGASASALGLNKNDKHH